MVDSNRKKRPKRKNGQGGLYHRKDGRWEAIWIECTPEGKKRRTAYGPTKDIAEAKMWQQRGMQIPEDLDLDDQNGRHVYFVQACSGGPIKIGVTNDIEKRLKNLQACCPIPLQLLYVVIGGGPGLERQLHERFALHRLHGEWFENTAELLSLIHQHRKQAKAERKTWPAVGLAKVY